MIKFKVYKRNNDKWHLMDDENFAVTRDGEIIIIEEEDMYGNFSYYYPTLQLEVVQFTGFYDKNEAEIYEGDIVDIDSYGRYLIKFENGYFETDCLETFGTEVFMFNSQLLLECSNEYGECKYVKIGGNKFENPELLELKGKENDNKIFFNL